MMVSKRTNSRSQGDRIDRFYRYAMLVAGILAAFLFLLSLVAMIEFPGAFNYMAIGMIVIAVLFLVLRTIYHFRDTFKIKQKKTTRK